ncbi:multidrug resistance protein mrp-7-like isoform X2 [Haemaphysalis longicornis]
MALLDMGDLLKLGAVACTLLSGVEVFDSRSSYQKRTIFFTLMDVAYVLSCAGTCTAFVGTGCQLAIISNLWVSWTPRIYFDLVFLLLFGVATAFMCFLHFLRRCRGQSAPGIVCAVHGMILVALTSDLLKKVEDSSCRHIEIEPLSSTLTQAASLSVCIVMSFGNFLTSGFSYRPTAGNGDKEQNIYHDLDSCSPFSKVISAIVLKHLTTTILKSKVVNGCAPRLTLGLRCCRNIETKCRNFITKVQGLRSVCLFYGLILHHAWREHLWANSLALLYYCCLLVRIPLFAGLIAGNDGPPFGQSALLLVVSCIAEFLVSSCHSYFTIRIQTKAHHLLQTAVLKKITYLSPAAASDNPVGHVSTLLAADSWMVCMSTYHLPSAFMGLVALVIALTALDRHIGHAAVCACVAWLVIVGAASVCTEPLIDKYCEVFYEYRDKRLNKFSEFLSSIRLIKMSALEDIFQKSLMELRRTEIKQAYCVNILDSLIETLFSASSSMMIILAFGTVMIINPDVVFKPAEIFSCVYILSLTDTFTNTTPHVIRLKSPVFRSCRRLMSFFMSEEIETGLDEEGQIPEIGVGNVTMEDCCFAWTKRNCEKKGPNLEEIDLHIKGGSLVAVAGTVGSGKSSLLSAITGHMTHLGGRIEINGRVAIVSQQPQVLNMSIRDNITFGRKFNERYYDEVLKTCQLQRDIGRMPRGDLTEAGEKGEMLSGGQKQRVAVARAVYSQSDVYLLDDPTSAQDARVAQCILKQVIGPTGVLANKTRVLVTNNVRLPFTADKWILMHDKTASSFESLKELKGHDKAPVRLFEEESRRNVQEISRESVKPWQPMEEDECTDKIIKEEGMPFEKGALEVAAAYFKYSGTWGPLALLCFVASAIFVSLELVCVKEWAEARMDESADVGSVSQSIILRLASFCLADVVFRLVAGVLLARASRQCSLGLHSDMLQRVASSPLSYFDATPRARILNRFSVDLEIIDSRTFVAYKQLFQNVFQIFGRLAIVGAQAPLVFGLVLGVISLLVFVMRYILRGTMIFRLYESTMLSKVLQHLAETLDSLGLIRCYGVMNSFCARSRRLMTTYLEAFNVFVLCYALARVLITFCGVLVILLTLGIAVVPAHAEASSAAAVGITLLSSLTVPLCMGGVFMVTFWNMMGQAAFERLLEYTEMLGEVEQETGTNKEPADEPNLCLPHFFSEPYDDTWPRQGMVKFDHFSASYRPGIAEDALKGICFEARAGQKVAIVGRTGAGKSSVVLSLLRMIQRTSGTITIDGRDIASVALKRLRSAISVIPQDPSLFCGTLRENLDPRGCKSDAELLKVLHSVNLDHLATKSPVLSLAISEKGGNLSAGERQLVSLARALLRGTKIMVLDEATSQMDRDTDLKVQTTLRKAFSQGTLITIAHRIDTILDYDSVVVMGDGRVLESGSVGDLLGNSASTFHSMALSAGIDIAERLRQCCKK